HWPPAWKYHLFSDPTPDQGGKLALGEFVDRLQGRLRTVVSWKVNDVPLMISSDDESLYALPEPPKDDARTLVCPQENFEMRPFLKRGGGPGIDRFDQNFMDRFRLLAQDLRRVSWV